LKVPAALVVAVTCSSPPFDPIRPHSAPFDPTPVPFLQVFGNARELRDVTKAFLADLEAAAAVSLGRDTGPGAGRDAGSGRLERQSSDGSAAGSAAGGASGPPGRSHDGGSGNGHRGVGGLGNVFADAAAAAHLGVGPVFLEHCDDHFLDVCVTHAAIDEWQRGVACAGLRFFFKETDIDESILLCVLLHDLTFVRTCVRC